MKSAKKICLTILSLLLFSLNVNAVEVSVEYKPTEDNVKYLGRSFLDNNNILWMCFSGTGAAFEVDAKRLDIEIHGDSWATGTEDENTGARIVVFVNGERRIDKQIYGQKQTITVFNERKAVTGEVKVIKVTETTSSLAGISKILVDRGGSITPSPDKDLKIEFIGDSITCGYGVDDLDRNHHFSASTEDVTKSYAYKAAELLNADYSMVCVSGWGIVSGYTSGSKQGEMVLPKIYNKYGFTWGRMMIDKQPKNINWDFSKVKSDFVVINLGTNDASYVKGDKTKKEEFVTAYIKFLKDIRSKNPDAKIICTLGIMGNDMFNSIKQAVDTYTADSGDKKVYLHPFNNQVSQDGIAADWHPSEKTHEKAAMSLVLKIRSL